MSCDERFFADIANYIALTSGLVIVDGPSQCFALVDLLSLKHYSSLS